MRSAAELEQVLAVEGRSRIRNDLHRAQCLSARRVEGVQPGSSGKPDVLTVIRDSMHVVDTRKGSSPTGMRAGVAIQSRCLAWGLTSSVFSYMEELQRFTEAPARQGKFSRL